MTERSVPVDLSAILAPVMAITEHGLRVLLQQARQFAAAGAVGAASPRRPSTADSIPGVRRIPIQGLITYRPTFLGSLFGWPSIREIQAALNEALADPGVGTILFDIDSPGGSVYGVEELATAIFAARSQKRIVAHAAPLAASAAYWIGAAAGEFYAMPSGETGSVGVIAIHWDESRALDAAGLTPTIMVSSPYKAEGTFLEPLGAEARAHFLDQIGVYHRKFTGAIAKFRGVSQATVESTFGQGRTVLAGKAVGLGMIDGLAASLADVLDRRRGPARSGSSAHARRIALAEAEIAIARARAS